MTDRRAYLEAWLLCLPWLPLRLLFVLPPWLLLFVLFNGWPRSWAEGREYVGDLGFEVRHALGLPARWIYDADEWERRLAEHERALRAVLHGQLARGLERVAPCLLPPGVPARVSLFTCAEARQPPLAEITQGPAVGEPIHSLDWPLEHEGERVGSLRCALFASVATGAGAGVLAGADAALARLVRQDETLRLVLSGLASFAALETRRGRAAARAQAAA